MQIEYTPGQSEAETAIIHTRWLQHRRIVHRRNRIVVLLALLAVIAVLADLFSGTAALSPLQVLQGLWQPDTLSVPMQVVLWDVRLPVALMALLVGGALALASVVSKSLITGIILPIGIVTSLVGLPVFMGLILRRSGERV